MDFGFACWCSPPRWPAAPPRPIRCRPAPPTRTSSCSIAAPKPRRTRSGSTRASTSATSSTTIRRARIVPTRSSRSATPTSARAAPRTCLLAANEFREFLTFYPTHPRADYAQLQLARSYTEQMLAPERDQIRDARRDQGDRDLPAAVSEQPVDARGAQDGARGQGSVERRQLSGRLLLLPHQVVHRRDRSLQGRAEERPAITATGTRSISTWPNRST